MEANQMTSLESLQIIEQMINTAKREQKDDGKTWIAWGWLLLAASIFTLINQRTSWINPFIVWNIIGVVAIAIRFLLFKRRQAVKTYTGDLLKKLNIGYFISLFVIIIAINIEVVSPIAGFAFLINLYAFWALVYGTALNFKPSIIGAFIVWGLGLAALFAKTFDQTMVLHAAAALAGFIIPGHIAGREFKKSTAA